AIRARSGVSANDERRRIRRESSPACAGRVRPLHVRGDPLSVDRPRSRELGDDRRAAAPVTVVKTPAACSRCTFGSPCTTCTESCCVVKGEALSSIPGLPRALPCGARPGSAEKERGTLW